MKKALLFALVSASILFPSISANAGHRHYYGQSGFHYRSHHDGNILIAAGIIGGAIILGSILTHPRHTHHTQYYYRPPLLPPVHYQRVYQPRCYKDKIRRYLPDGRIQWGTRTTCY